MFWIAKAHKTVDNVELLIASASHCGSPKMFPNTHYSSHRIDLGSEERVFEVRGSKGRGPWKRGWERIGTRGSEQKSRPRGSQGNGFCAIALKSHCAGSSPSAGHLD